MCRLLRTGAYSLSLALCSAGAAPAEESALQFSGYYKNLLIESRTLTQQPFNLDLNRLRLALKGHVTNTVSVDLQYDNEVLVGSYLRTLQFQQQKDLPPPQFWNLDANWRETPDFYGRQRLYRGSLNVSAGDTDLRIGRQRIAWGTGRFWSPLDLLNPVDPVTIEREERLGTDALLIERKFGPLSRASFVYAPGRSSASDARAVRWHGNARGVDYSLLLADVAATRITGTDLAGALGQAGWRAELARFSPRTGAAYTRALAGIDYAFANSLTVTAEAYYNGAGATNTASCDFASLGAGRIQPLGRRYAAAHAGYDITPLVKSELDVVVNLADRSRYIGVSVAYSATANVELRAGIQRFSGGAGTEFQRVPNTVYLQLQHFF